MDKALDTINRQVRFIVVAATGEDAGSEVLAVRDDEQTPAHTYPPITVAEPQLLQEVPASLDGEVPPSAEYRYNVYFQSTESPGYPALDFSLRSLDFVIKDGITQGSLHFPLQGV